MLLQEHCATLFSQLGGSGGPTVVSALCQPRVSPLVPTSRCMSLRAGEMPVRFGATAGHAQLQQDGQEGQLRPHLRLQGSFPARYGGVRRVSIPCVAQSRGRRAAAPSGCKEVMFLLGWVSAVLDAAPWGLCTAAPGVSALGAQQHTNACISFP